MNSLQYLEKYALFKRVSLGTKGIYSESGFSGVQILLNLENVDSILARPNWDAEIRQETEILYRETLLYMWRTAWYKSVTIRSQWIR